MTCWRIDLSTDWEIPCEGVGEEQAPESHDVVSVFKADCFVRGATDCDLPCCGVGRSGSYHACRRVPPAQFSTRFNQISRQ